MCNLSITNRVYKIEIYEKKIETLILANFGGPRNVKEIPSFLIELLNDRDVIWTNFPNLIHRLLFTYIAKKRAKKIEEDYLSIGGKSPIFEDTEAIAQLLQEKLQIPVLCFHRYLPETHAEFFEKVNALNSKKTVVFPLYPQFSYATTGSIARLFQEKLHREALLGLEWIKSYPQEEGFTQPFSKKIALFLKEKNLLEEEIGLFFSAHGVPQRFICFGDVYKKECEASFEKIGMNFPKAEKLLCYQSKFGKGEWIKPYTVDVSTKLPDNFNNKKAIIFIPLSFTSDHIETLFEVENLYLPLVEAQGVKAYRVEALNRDMDWIEGIISILNKRDSYVSNAMLIRHKFDACCSRCSSCCLCN